MVRRSLSSWLLVFVLVGAGITTASVASAQQAIGQADEVVASVQGALAGRVRQLGVADPVFHDELIDTASDAASRLRFQDGSVLTVGPSTRVTLDDFVYDPNPSRQRLTINMARGVLRFASGRLDKNAYVIVTPTAVIGVRGTVFTVTVDPDGGTTIRVEEGRIRATNPAGAAIEAGAEASVWLQPPVRGAFPAPLGPLALGVGGPVITMDQILESSANPPPFDNGLQPDQFIRNRNHDNNRGGNSGGNGPG